MGSKVDVERWEDRRDGPVNEAVLRARLERRGYAVSRYSYAPGTRFPEHVHGVDKIDAVVAGRFRIVLEGQEVVLRPGDSVAVPRGVVHSAAVVGKEPVISLDAVKAR